MRGNNLILLIIGRDRRLSGVIIDKNKAIIPVIICNNNLNE